MLHVLLIQSKSGRESGKNRLKCIWKWNHD